MKVINIKGKYGEFQASWDEHSSECKFCGDSIGWATTRKGKKVPIDIEEDEQGIMTTHFETCERGKNGNDPF